MKNRNARKLLAAVLTAAMAMSVLTGCGDTKPEGSDSAGSKTQESSAAGQESQGEKQEEKESGGDAAASGELKTIRIMGVDNSTTLESGKSIYLSDWVEGDSKVWNQLLSDLEERGVTLEVDLIPQDQYDTVLQNSVAAGLDCDFLNLTPLDDKTRTNLISQGKLLPLDDLIEQYASEEGKAFYNTGYGSEAARVNRREDGKLYWVGAMTVGDYKGEAWGSFIMPMIRKDWLDKVGMEIPKTADELYDALKAFQDQDVNGNGTADEVAYVNIGSYQTGLAQCFGLGNGLYYLDPVEEKILCNWYQPGIKEYIAFMQKLYSAGLLDTSGQYNEKLAENKLALVNDWVAETYVEPSITVQEGAAAPNFTGFLFQGAEGIEPILNRQDGVQIHIYGYGATDQADPEAIGILLDYLASDAYATLSEYGVEGYTYERTADGRIKRLPATEGIEETEVMSKLVALWVGYAGGGILPRMEIVDRVTELETTQDAGREMGYPEEGYADKAAFIRNIYENGDQYQYCSMGMQLANATEEETDRTTELATDLWTYTDELLVKLIMGEQSLDDWDTYIAEIKELGMDEIIQIHQDRYDRIH